MSTFTITKLRADVLSILQQAKQPLKAYEILERLREIRPKAQPPTVYRVLDFLKQNDAIHEITHQHSFVLCQDEQHADAHPMNVLLVCNRCASVSEEQANKLETSLTSITKQHHFQPTTATVEVVGLCQQCQ